MTILLVTIIVFGVLVTIHEWGHFIVAKRQGIQVDVFSVGFGPLLFKYKWHGTLYAISLIPLGGYVKMAGDDPSEDKIEREGDEFFAKTPWQRMKVVMAGPLMNYFLAYAIFTFIFVIGSPAPTTKIGIVMENMPAQQAGLRTGDTITAVNGESVKFWDQLTAYIRAHGSEELRLDVVREGQNLTVTLLPDMDKERPIIGIKASQETQTVQYPLVKSFGMAGQKLWFISSMTYRSLWNMATGKMSLKQSMTGPIGIMFITGETAKKGWIHVLHLMGLLSAALALFNFLPIPVLDGGHFVLYVIEWVRKKPLNLKIQETLQKVGIFFLLGLMLYVFYNDFVNFKVGSKLRGLWFVKNIAPDVPTKLDQADEGPSHDSQ